jgi:hypothetical protein
MELITPTPFNPKSWGRRLSIEQINKVRVPEPEGRYRAVPHQIATEMLEERLAKHNFQVSEPAHYLSKNEGSMLSMYAVALDGLPEMPGVQAQWEFCLRNSYDKTVSLQLLWGTRVFICGNGMVLADNKYRRKHTTNIMDDIHAVMTNGVQSLISGAATEVEIMEAFQQSEVTDYHADHLIMEAMRRKIINPAGVGEVWQHWSEPEHEEFKPRTKFSLMNAFTSRDRGRNLFTQPERMSGVRSLLLEPANA